MKILTVLGSTGSIGTNTLDVVRRSRHLYQVYALVAGHNVETLASQIVEFRPKIAAVATSEGLARLTNMLAPAGLPPTPWAELLSGSDARGRASNAAAGLESSHLANGQPHHDRLRHADE